MKKEDGQMIRFKNRFTVGVLAVVLVVCISSFAFSQVVRTACEESGFEQYTSYEEMWDYLQKIQATSTEMLLGTFGITIEGREQPYAVFSRPLITQPWEALVSGKPIVVLAANVHGGERTLRESNLILTRELATKGSDMNWLLDDLVVIVVPSVNPDGFVRGSRGNSLGIDMNRDYMKLEQPSLRNFVQNILLTWHPHVTVDGHNGGSFPYNVTYQANSHASPDQRITILADQEIFPFIDRKMEAQGYKSWYYSGGDSTSWRGGGFDPRISRNYAAFINCVGILFESPGRQEREPGIKSGVVAYKAVVQYAYQNAERLKMVVDRARRETIEMGQNAMGNIPIQVRYVPEDYKVSYEIGITVGGTIDPETGRRTGGTREIVKITGADLVKKPEITKTRPRPYAYVLEARAWKAVELLKQHKIMIEVLQEDTEIDVEAYNMTNVEFSPEYDHPASVTVTFADETVKQTQTFPKGTYIIRTGQVMGRVVAHLLEPETNDNVVKWNAMDALLPSAGRGRGMATFTRARRDTTAVPVQARFMRARVDTTVQVQVPQIQEQEPRPRIFPIFKIMTPTKLPTKMLKY